MTDDCLEGRHQGAGLDGLPRFRDGGLESVRFRRLPILEDLANTGRIDVAGCSDAADPAAAQRIQQEDFRAGKGAEPREGIEDRFRVRPVAAAVFQADNRIRVFFDQPADEIEAERRPGLRWDVVEVDFQGVVADPLHDFGEPSEETVIRHALVVERRQHQNAAAAMGHSVLVQANRFVDRAGAGSRHEFVARYTGFDQRIEQGHPLVGGLRVRFAGSAKDSEAVRALRQEPAAKGGKTTHIRAQIGGKWGENWRQNAAERLIIHNISSFVKFRPV